MGKFDFTSTTDIFFDCVSTSLDGESSRESDKSSKLFMVHPILYWNHLLIYPEQYTLADLFNDGFSVHAIMQSQEDEQIQKVFITYARHDEGGDE